MGIGPTGGPQRSKERTPLNRYYSGGSKAAPQPNSPFRPNPVPVPKKNTLVKIADYLIILIVLATIFYNLWLQPLPKVQASSYIYHSQAAYLSAATKSVGGLEDKNKLTFNEQAVVKSLRRQFPELSTVSVEIPIIGRQPRINLKVATPAYFINSAGKTYILDSDGVIATTASQQPKIKNLVTIYDQSNFQLNIGSAALAGSSVGFINTVVSQSQHAGVPIKSLTLPAVAQELDLRTTDQPYYVKFYLGGNALNQVGQFLAARHQFNQNHTQPSAYLDARVEGKVFYQ